MGGRLFHNVRLEVGARGADDNITGITALEFNVQRSSIDVIHSLETLLSKDQVSTEASVLESYGQDWTRFTPPAPLAIVFPRSTNERGKTIASGAGGVKRVQS